MKLLAVNVAAPRTIQVGGSSISTGIYKEPVIGRVRVESLGLAGDVQVDRKNHGGIHLAVYTYPFAHYEYWSRVLDRRDFAFGQFGENLTVTGLTEDEVHIGDVFRIGSVLLEVTQPRVPCFKLAHKMGRPEFIQEFAASGRVGFYQRVLAEGEIGAGDTIERVHEDPRRVTVRELMELRHFKRGGLELLQRVLAVPALTPGWHDELQARLTTFSDTGRTAV